MRGGSGENMVEWRSCEQKPHRKPRFLPDLVIVEAVDAALAPLLVEAAGLGDGAPLRWAG